MVESLGMQQVLQLSSVVEKAQMAQQSKGAEVARAFDRELEKQTAREGDKTQAVNETPEDMEVREDESRGQNEQRMAAKKRAVAEEEKEDEQGPPSETGHGGLINVVA